MQFYDKSRYKFIINDIDSTCEESSELVKNITQTKHKIDDKHNNSTTNNSKLIRKRTIAPNIPEQTNRTFTQYPIKYKIDRTNQSHTLTKPVQQPKYESVTNTNKIPNNQILCIYGTECKNKLCQFKHPSKCKYGNKCIIQDCKHMHPTKCKYGNKCKFINNCSYTHPPKCHYGIKCHNMDCGFVHV